MINDYNKRLGEREEEGSMSARTWPTNGLSLAAFEAFKSIPFERIDFNDPIFDSIRADYPDLEEWRLRGLKSSCARCALVVRNSTKSYSGIAILKEGEGPAGPLSTGLKISTFKVAAAAQAQGVADILLSKIFERAIQLEVDVLFVTVKPNHEDISRYFELRGFRRASRYSVSGEHIYTADIAHPERIYSGINRLAYDVLAEEYRIRSDSPGPNQESPEYLAGLLLSRLSKPVGRLLELGPGSGGVLAALENSATETIAVEISPKMAALSTLIAPRALTIVGDILNIDFIEHSFDGIYAGAFLHLFPHAEAASLLRRMARWTKPEGAVFVNTSISDQASQSIELKADYIHRVARFRSRWTEDQFRLLVESNGFRVLDRVTTDEQERGKFWVAFICTPTPNGGA